MPTLQDPLPLDETARKWSELADRRLAYFTELYRSGRWAHYYSRESFALRMRDVIKAARIWSDLADRIVAKRALAERPAVHDDWLRPAA